MCEHIRQAHEQSFSEMYGLRGPSGTVCFFQNWPSPLMPWGFLPVLVRFQTFFPPPPPKPQSPGALLGGLRDTYFGGGVFKIICFGEGWDSGTVVRGQNYEKMGYSITVDAPTPSFAGTTVPNKMQYHKNSRFGQGRACIRGVWGSKEVCRGAVHLQSDKSG